MPFLERMADNAAEHHRADRTSLVIRIFQTFHLQ